MMVTAGSRGDVEPFAALGLAAAAAGHDVLLVAPRNSGVRADGIETVDLDVDFSAFIQRQGVSPSAAMRAFRSEVRPIMRTVITAPARLALERRPDALVFHPKILSGPDIGAALGIPAFLAEIVPAVTPTREFPAAGTLARSAGPLNRATYRATAAAGAMFAADVREARALLGRPSRGRSATPTGALVPVSPVLLPRPADWPASTVLTGSWARERATPGDPSALAFAERAPFVYAGFGSMVGTDPLALGAAVVLAARARGLRVLMARGLGGIALPENLRGEDVLVVDDVDHARILPLAQAAVHHGGAGTVHAAARAGTTSIVIPFLADQPWWGALLHRRGLAPEPIAPRRATPGRLGAALDAVGALAERNRDLAPEIAAEHGAEVALAAVENAARRGRD